MIAEIIGIPGSGKTYYLDKLKNEDLKCIDFGSELKSWLKNNNKSFIGNMPSFEDIKEFIDSLYTENKEQNLIITSHIVHYKEGKFLYDLESEIYANADVHIFVYSEPSDILKRREKDSAVEQRQREIGTIDEIREHQDLSLKLTKDLSEKLGSKFILIENNLEKELNNISEIKNLLNKEKNPNSKYFDKWAIDFKDLPDENSFHLQYIGEMLKKENLEFMNKEDICVMDLGMGNGRFFSSLGFCPKKLMGIDISKKQLELAKQKLSSKDYNLDLIKCDLENDLPLENSCVDLTISNASIHHVRNKLNLFKEIHRTLKEKGKLIIFDYYFGDVDFMTLRKIRLSQRLDSENSKKFIDSIRQEHNLMPEELDEIHPEEYHLSPQEITDLLSKAGFKDCKIIPTFYPKYIGVCATK